MKCVLLGLLCASCGLPAYDYAPPALKKLGIHNSVQYVATTVMPAQNLSLVLVSPRLAYATIRRAGESFVVNWIGGSATASLLTDDVPAAALPLTTPSCDANNICTATAVTPAMATGLYGICVQTASAQSCSPHALQIVDHYNEPITVVHITDVHVGDGDSIDKFTHVVDAINQAPPDVVIFTGDAAHNGHADERAQFLAQLQRLNAPVWAVTGNHDYKNAGIDGFLIDVNPALDLATSYGTHRMYGFSDGQDLDSLSTITSSDGPDASQLAWLREKLPGAASTILFFHHPVYSPAFAMIGNNRDALIDAIGSAENLRAVLVGHLHARCVFDGEGDSRGLNETQGSMPAYRWPLHYLGDRTTSGNGGYGLDHIGDTVDYHWIDL